MNPILLNILAVVAGVVVGAFIAAKFAVSHRVKLAMGIGVFFLVGGITASAMLGGTTWFVMADLVLAYIPMGWLGAVIAGTAGKAVSAIS